MRAAVCAALDVAGDGVEAPLLEGAERENGHAGRVMFGETDYVIDIVA